MSNTIRLSPSGPEVTASTDTVVDPGEVLGRPLASLAGPAIPLTGVEVGAIARFASETGQTFTAGTTSDNFPLSDGTSLLSAAVSAAGTAVITGFRILGARGNSGAFFVLRKANATGILILRPGTGSSSGNQLSTPGGVDFQLLNAGDSALLQYIDDGVSPGTFQVIGRLVPAAGVSPPVGNFVVLEQWVLAFPPGPGGAPDDVIMTTQVPFPLSAVDVAVDTNVAVPGSNIQLRSGAGATGSFLSDNISTATAGITTRNNAANSQSTSTGIFIRRSDSGIGATVILTVSRN